MTTYQKSLETIARKAADAAALLESVKLNPANIPARIRLLQIVTDCIAYHTSGKIEGIFSLDSSCRVCSFCQDMQEAGKYSPELICGLCYTQSIHDTALAKHEIPARILSEILFTGEEWSAAAVPIGLIRFNCDGELINATHAMNLLRAAATHPLTQFAIWTKRPGILAEAIQAEGKPNNLKIGISSPIINKPFSESFSFADFIFTVYTPNGILSAIARGEHECNGKKCRDCGFYCYTKATHANGPAHIAEALRRPYYMSKAKFAELCAQIDAKTLPAFQDLPF